jgi:hypothetical protein
MVIVYVPGAVLCLVRMVSVDVPEPELNETLLELRLSVGPVGAHVAERDTVPVNPLMLARLIVTVPLLPAVRLSELTLVLRLKSWTLTVIVTVCVVEPLVPVRVTV